MAFKILLADDSMTAQNLAKKILIDVGYEVIAVSNGAAALKKIASERPDLLILDIYMPGYTGLEVCEKIKTAPGTAHTPVLLTVAPMEPYENPQTEIASEPTESFSSRLRRGTWFPQSKSSKSR